MNSKTNNNYKLKENMNNQYQDSFNYKPLTNFVGCTQPTIQGIP